jgi:uncharacterized protein (DUF1697 family)
MFAFLKGVNIGGHKKIAMPALKKAFEAMGFKNVRTALASGNVVFEAPGRGAPRGHAISQGLEEAFGFPVMIVLRSAAEIREMIASEPFRGVPEGPTAKPCVTFLPDRDPRRPRLRLPEPEKGLRIVRVTPGEIFSIVCYDENGRTPALMTYVARVFGADGTTRTWGTVVKCAAVAGRP